MAVPTTESASNPLSEMRSEQRVNFCQSVASLFPEYSLLELLAELRAGKQDQYTMQLTALSPQQIKHLIVRFDLSHMLINLLTGRL